jgi:hypothetical protein
MTAREKELRELEKIQAFVGDQTDDIAIDALLLQYAEVVK